jgi:hypothetical protein
MESVTTYAPVRIALLGILRATFGLLLGVAGAAVIWATAAGEMKPTQPGDMPSWWMMLVGVALALTALCFVIGGLGRVISAFARDCYFRAGPDGIAIRLPKQTWWGRFRMTEYRFRWEEIKQLVPITNRLNLIPVSRELQIVPLEGETVSIQRHFFSASVKEIQQRLLAIRASVGR